MWKKSNGVWQKVMAHVINWKWKSTQDLEVHFAFTPHPHPIRHEILLAIVWNQTILRMGKPDNPTVVVCREGIWGCFKEIRLFWGWESLTILLLWCVGKGFEGVSKKSDYFEGVKAWKSYCMLWCVGKGFEGVSVLFHGIAVSCLWCKHL